MHPTWLLVITFLAAAASPAQRSRDASAAPPEGVAVAVRTADDLEKAWGLRDQEIRDAAESGIRSASWRVDERAGAQISVEITQLAQQDEDLFPLRITVRGSWPAPAEDTGRMFPPEVTASRVVHVPWAERTRITGAVRQMAAGVARKMLSDVARSRH